jgi:hypothetical protein
MIISIRQFKLREWVGKRVTLYYRIRGEVNREVRKGDFRG